MTHSRRAVNFVHLFVGKNRLSPGAPSTAPEPTKFEPQVFYRAMAKMEYDSFKQDFFIPARP
eukprot:10246199-Alexandrium_andersonii.AAC.1